jgi:hypothetical protein
MIFFLHLGCAIPVWQRILCWMIALKRKETVLFRCLIAHFPFSMRITQMETAVNAVSASAVRFGLIQARIRYFRPQLLMSAVAISKAVERVEAAEFFLSENRFRFSTLSPGIVQPVQLVPLLISLLYLVIVARTSFLRLQ